MRLLAIFVAWLSLGQLLTAVVLLGPHADGPGRPSANLLVVGAAIGGFALSRALWRRRVSAARALPWWAAGVSLWIVWTIAAVASAAEWREATLALTFALPLWAGLVWFAVRYVRRNAKAAV